ncbi:MAG: CotH kinase family protein [Aureispira sp.]
MSRSLVGLISWCFLLTSCYKEVIVFDSLPDEQLQLPLLLELNEKACFLDAKMQELRYAIATDSIPNFTPTIRFQSYSKIRFNNHSLTNNHAQNLGTVSTREVYSVQVTTQGETQAFTLRFTKFPLVQIVTNNTIVDAPKKIARLTINYPQRNKARSSSYVGIDYRGGLSQFNPKKSYGFSFLERGDLATPTSKAVFDWSPNEAWILDALYRDPSKVRNQLSFQLWEMLSSNSKEVIQTQLVELYFNNSYQGLYSLNEQMNAEHLGLVDPNAVLYKATSWEGGATRFEHLNTIPPSNNEFWDGWEQKYPAPKTGLYWQPLYDLRNWVVNNDGITFKQKAEEQVALDNLVDYYLFINLIAASDNYGKNLFWMRPNATTPLSIIPWDLDATWGRYWDGIPFQLTDVVSNALFDRLLDLDVDNFRRRLKNRWTALRAGPWTTANLQAEVAAAFNPLLESRIETLEEETWNVELDLLSEKQYMQHWIQDRVVFLDTYFQAL